MLTAPNLNYKIYKSSIYYVLSSCVRVGVSVASPQTRSLLAAISQYSKCLLIVFLIGLLGTIV